MIYPDVLVMGVGRSGTSTVARVLHSNLGVCMGMPEDWEWHPEGDDGNNPRFACTYESLVMMGVTRTLVNREHQEISSQVNGDWRPSKVFISDWLNIYQLLHKGCTHRYHGVKNTQLSLCSIEQLRALKPKLVVRTWRLRNETIDSLLRWRSHRFSDRSHWEKFYDEREQSMDILESQSEIPFVTVDFPCHREDEEIIGLLKPYVDRFVKGVQKC